MELIGAGELIKKSWSLYWSNWTTLVLIALWSFIPVVASILIGLIPESLWLAALFLSIAVGIGAIIIGLWVYVSLTRAIAKLYNNQKIDVKQIYQKAWDNIIPLLWVSILSGLAIFGGTLLLIIPGIIFAVWFAFASVIVVLENTRGSAALSQSKKLVSGRWWSIFWRFIAVYFVYGVLFYTVTILLMVGVGLVSGSWEALASGASPDAVMWVESLASSLINVVAMPLFSAVTIIFYLELKKFKNA